MQSKGLIKFVAIALTLGCLYSLSFTWMAKKVEGDARDYAKGDPQKEKAYLDSVASEPVFDFLPFSYNYVKERVADLKHQEVQSEFCWFLVVSGCLEM